MFYNRKVFSPSNEVDFRYILNAIFHCVTGKDCTGSLCVRDVLLTWSWSLCAQEIWQFWTHRTRGLALHYVHSESFVMRKHQICCVWGIYAENALAVLWMHRWDLWYSYAGPSCLPHVLYSCAVEASKAEWALSKKPIFPGTMGSAGLQGAGTGRWMAEVADLPKTHCKSICVAKTLRAVRYI